uniref:Uncharacterized protein n=1 Tax=Bradyrhizobium amphicarpaeae TaxID=1404768 RepID=A0A2U8Q0X7_9BRAD|nr:hypothetical protein CIT40_29300 [Bradyrhizobium amphicarpaeae]
MLRRAKHEQNAIIGWWDGFPVPTLLSTNVLDLVTTKRLLAHPLVATPLRKTANLVDFGVIM